jgi:RHS repeat-associated protein
LERYSNTNPALGKLESATIQYDLDGNIVRDDEGNTLSYNAFNRLVSFQKNAQTTEYFYNGQGTLVSQKNPGNSQELKFYYSGNILVNEKQGNIVNSYFNSNGKISGKFTTGNTEQYYLTDQANSVIRIMEGKKLLANNYVYTPYGIQTDLNVTLVSSSGSTGDSSIIKTSIGFDGQRTDSQTGYQVLGKGYRAYNPVLHRFMQYDSFSPFGKGGINGYTFAENNPIMNFDPTGESAALNIGLAVGFTIIGIIGSIFTFGAAAGAVSVGLAAASTVLGAASGATGIAGAVYGKYAEDAAKSGNKDAAASYAKTASDLGWASLGLGLAAVAADIGSIASAAGKKGTISITRSYSTASTASVNSTIKSTSNLTARMRNVAIGGHKGERAAGQLGEAIGEHVDLQRRLALEAQNFVKAGSITRSSSVASRSGISTNSFKTTSSIDDPWNGVNPFVPKSPPSAATAESSIIHHLATLGVYDTAL